MGFGPLGFRWSSVFFVFWVPNLQVFKVFSTRANESGGGGPFHANGNRRIDRSSVLWPLALLLGAFAEVTGTFAR